MRKTFRTGLLMMALMTAGSGSGLAASGATDRSNAFGYTFTAEELDSFPQKTNLPTVYLQVYKTTYDAATDATSFTLDGAGNAVLEDLSELFKDRTDWYYKTKIVIRDDQGTIKERNEWLGVRGRGNATWRIGEGSYKRPLRLKFPQKTDLLTTQEDGVEVNHFARAKSWTLLANFYDATLIRNALTYELGQKVGLPFCPAYKFVDLYVNGVYLGNYQFSDHVQVAADRVNIDEATGYFVEALESKQGFLEDPYLSVNYGGNAFYVNVKSPDADVATANDVTQDPKYADLKAHLEKVSKLAYSGPYNIYNSWRRYVDMETAVNAFIAMDMTGNYDGAVGNDYAYMNDLQSPICFGPLWDFDLAWNAKVNGNDMSGKHFWEGEDTPFAELLKQVYENDPYFVKAVYERWQEIYADGDLTTYLQGCVDRLAASIQQSATLNYASTAEGGAGMSLNKYGWADANNYESLEAAYESLKTFVATHTAYLQTDYKAKYDELGCADLPEITEESGLGLVSLGKHSWDGQEYIFTGNAKNMLKDATLTITVEGSGAYFDAYLSDSYTTKWFNSSSSETVRELTADDAQALAANDYQFRLLVYGGTCVSVTLVPKACVAHDYEGCTYAKQDDGSYLRVCNVCGEEETDGVYYQFTVYPESSVKTTLYATGWQPSEEHPNAIALVSVTPGVESQIEGYNIVNSTKNSLGDQVCADFRLVDGHPYYSESKFVATKATYSRSVANNWGTMILPFKYQEASNETAAFYHLDQTDEADGTLTLVMTPIDPLVDGNASAYTPVVFMRANDEVKTVTVTGENITVKKLSADKSNCTLEGWTLTGVMEQTVFNVADEAYADKDVYYISNDAFWHATGKVTTNPFRAYLSKPKTATAARSIRITAGAADEPSAVKSLNANECLALFVADGQLTVVTPKAMAVTVSSLGGAVVCRRQMLAGQRLALQLAKGVYVVNGVKVIVK